jgi:3,4-dihydroxy 2-butanone 4-phosphate synthase/GTP cyclohydrolase II
MESLSESVRPDQDRSGLGGESTRRRVELALSAIRSGGCVVVVDDESRENEGDVVMAAEHATPEAINFIVTHARGLLCVSLTGSRLAELQIPPMVDSNTAIHQTAFGVSVDLKLGHSRSGISVADRAATINALCAPATRPEMLARPGHIFPLHAQAGGVLKRAGHTEAGVDITRLAGCYPAAVLCEILAKDGGVARGPVLQEFAAEHQLPMISIAELIAFRRRTEDLVRRVASAELPTDLGKFDLSVYESTIDDHRYVALVMGKPEPAVPTLVRVHSECLTGDVFHSVRCDCGEQLQIALNTIAEAGAGVLLYIKGDEGRGIGLVHKIRAYDLQDQGLDTVQANLELGFAPDHRDYGLGAAVLCRLGVGRMRLMTNNPDKYLGLDGFGLEIVERIAIETTPRSTNLRYLRTKRDKLGHILGSLEAAGT